VFCPRSSHADFWDEQATHWLNCVLFRYSPDLANFGNTTRGLKVLEGE
jgi:hypothetical protein